MLAELLSYDFMIRALVGGVMVSLVCALLSFFVVLRRLSFIGVGISHSAFGGLALGVALGINPSLSAALFAMAVAWGIGVTSRRGKLHEDTTIGIFFSAAMAFGVALLSLSDEYRTDLFSLLFGNILAITAEDLWLLAICGGAVVIFLLLYFKELLTVCFDEEVAVVGGIPATFLYYGLLAAMSLTVVVAIKVVGIVLVEALLVIPAATGHQLARGWRGMLAWALASSLLAMVGGLLLSYSYDLASGATIVLCAALLFGGAFIVSPRRR
jgi:zinc transport system permease protein